MKMYSAPPIAEDIAIRMRGLWESGIDRERLIGEMRGAGLHIVECIKLVRDLYGIDLGEAKRVVHLSAAWSDMRDSAERLHDEMIQVAVEEGWIVEEGEYKGSTTATAA